MKNVVLKVFLWNKEVGCLRWDERKSLAYFVFNKDFLSSGLDVFPLLAPINASRAYLPVAGDKRKIYCGLPPFIADSLPDHWGNLVFEQWMNSNGLKNNAVTPLDKLAFIGKRAMGALEYRPETERKDADACLAIDELAELAEKIYSQRAGMSVLPSESLTLQSLFDIGTSAGGRQPKAVVAINDKTGEIKSGQISGLNDFSYHILKFAVNDGYPATEMEMTYYELAVNAGLKMMPSRILHTDRHSHFLTERFDRKDGKKVFVQTLSAINPDAESYEDLFSTCRKLHVPEQEIRELFRQMAFNFFASNTDDHNKNFSFIMDENGSWHLTPPYDMTFTADLRSPATRHLHCMSMFGKLDGVTADDMMKFAVEHGVKNAGYMIEKVCESITHFRETAMKNAVPLVWVDRVEEYLQSIVPEKFKDKMSGWKPREVSSEMNGRVVENIHFEMSSNGNIHLCAIIDGNERKYVFSSKNIEFQSIINKGFNMMPDEDKIEYVKQYIIK